MKKKPRTGEGVNLEELEGLLIRRQYHSTYSQPMYRVIADPFVQDMHQVVQGLCLVRCCFSLDACAHFR